MVETCTIITTQPNELMESIHDRMPVIIDPANYERWLDPANKNTDDLCTLLRAYPSQDMAATRVGIHVNSPKNDDEECIRAVE
jgi:putative SOS response-associated peptidase YedK